MAERLEYYRFFYTATPGTSTKVLKRGEMGLEDVGAGYFPSFRIGDGTTQYKDLPLAGNLNFSVFATEAGTTKTLGLGDLGKCFKMTSATGGTLSLPLNATVAIPIGFMCEILWWTGTVAHKVTAVTGVTIEDTTAGTFTLSKKYSRAVIEKVDTNKWLVKGEGSLA